VADRVIVDAAKSERFQERDQWVGWMVAFELCLGLGHASVCLFLHCHLRRFVWSIFNGNHALNLWRMKDGLDVSGRSKPASKGRIKTSQVLR